jgi:DNA-binding transcriptional MocR family regulator
VFTRAVWIVTPGFPQRCKIFEDNGLEGKLRFVPEDSEGIDIELLERLISTEETKATASVNVRPVRTIPWRRGDTDPNDSAEGAIAGL